MVHEAPDAADTVVWLREQPWFTGTFATIGLSYLGYTQWALMADPPPELAAAMITVGPHDFHASSWGTGSFSLNDFLGWSHMMAHQHEPPLQRLASQSRAARRLERGVARRAAGQRRPQLLGAGSPWYESWIEHPDADDPFWETMRMTAALDRCEVPVLLLERMAGPVPGPDHHPVPASARTAGRRGDDDRAVDAHRDGRQGDRHRCRRDTDLAGRPPGQASDAAAAEQGARLRHPPRLGEPGGLAAGHRRRRDVPAVGGPADGGRTTGRRAAVDLPL